MDPIDARRALATGRLGVGLLALAAPRVLGRLVGIDPATNAAVPFMTRMFGARELYMAAPFLMPAPGLDEAELASRGVPVDAVDAAAALFAGARGYLPWRAALLTAAAAGGGMYLGSIGATNEKRIA